jgi:hypothetical protein
MFDWIPNLLLYIGTQFFIAVLLGFIIGFGVRDALHEWYEYSRVVTKAEPSAQNAYTYDVLDEAHLILEDIENRSA